jgi:hypothetical protein
MYGNKDWIAWWSVHVFTTHLLSTRAQVQMGGANILTDPIFSERCSPTQLVCHPILVAIQKYIITRPWSLMMNPL